jgi:hypothetical protein
VFDLVLPDLASIHIVKCDAERPWLLCEEVRIVFNCLRMSLPCEEAFGQISSLLLLQAKVVQLEPRACKVRLQNAHVVLPVHAEDARLPRQDELTVL